MVIKCPYSTLSRNVGVPKNSYKRKEGYTKFIDTTKGLIYYEKVQSEKYDPKKYDYFRSLFGTSSMHIRSRKDRNRSV
jgi:hypothetical protein